MDYFKAALIVALLGVVVWWIVLIQQHRGPFDLDNSAYADTTNSTPTKVDAAAVYDHMQNNAATARASSSLWRTHYSYNYVAVRCATFLLVACLVPLFRRRR